MHRPETDRPRFVIYYRTGLPAFDWKAQRAAVDRWGWFNPFVDVAEFTEIEGGGSENRPQLRLAISRAWESNADVLIADIGLLTRDIPFLRICAGADRAYGIKFRACGLFKGEHIPVGFMLATAESLSASHSKSTKEWLAAAKARGVKIGAAGPRNLPIARATYTAMAATGRARHLAIITKIQRETGAKTLQEIADALTARGVKTPRGLDKWSPPQVSRVLGSKPRKCPHPNEAEAFPEKPLEAGDPKSRVLH